jgi:heme/copper-type cytochrome/quinol oxidase subunit 3
MHGAHVLGGLALLGVVWLRLEPVRYGGQPPGSLSSSTFSAVRILWYFGVGLWPVLCLSLYL